MKCEMNMYKCECVEPVVSSDSNLAQRCSMLDVRPLKCFLEETKDKQQIRMLKLKLDPVGLVSVHTRN